MKILKRLLEKMKIWMKVYIADYLTKLFKLSSRVSNIDRYINKAEKVLCQNRYGKL